MAGPQSQRSERIEGTDTRPKAQFVVSEEYSNASLADWSQAAFNSDSR